MTAPARDKDAGHIARLDAASAIARKVGQRALELQASGGALDVRSKGPQDFVTRVDVETEELIRDALVSQFPGDGFLGEESAASGSVGSRYWVVDPIDGTSNFIKGLPHWGVSIAYVDDAKVRVGVVYDPVSDALYTARRSAGAHRNGQPISASQADDPRQAVAILGYSRRHELDEHFDVIRQLHQKGIDYRRQGSGAIGLVHVAEGLAELYYERHLYAWDALAGMLIAQEAGAQVMAPPIDVFSAQGGPVLVSAAGLADVLRFMHSVAPGASAGPI